MENSPRRSLPLNISDFFFGLFHPPVSNFVHTGQKMSSQNLKILSKSASSTMNDSEKMNSCIDDSDINKTNKNTFFQSMVGVFDSITNVVSKIPNYTHVLNNTLSVTVVPNDDGVSSEFLLRNSTTNKQDSSLSNDNLAKLFGNTTNKNMCDVNNHITQVFTAHRFKNLNLVNADNATSSERMGLIHDEEYQKNLIIEEKNNVQLAIEESLKHMKNYNPCNKTDSNDSALDKELQKNYLNTLTNSNEMSVNFENKSQKKPNMEQWTESDNLVEDIEEVPSKMSMPSTMKRKSNTIARCRGKGRSRFQLRKSGVSQSKHRKERIKQNIYSNMQEDLHVWEDDQTDSSGEQHSIISSSTDDESQNNNDNVCDMEEEYPALIESIRLGDSLSIDDKEEEKSLENLTHSEFVSTFNKDSRRLSQSSVESDDSCFIVFEDESADEEDSESTDYSDDDSTDSEDDNDSRNSEKDDEDEVDGGLKSDPQVRFNLKPTVHTIIKWDYAYRAARKGPWEQFARDRERFRCRIHGMSQIIEPILTKEHRDCVWENRFAVEDESM